MSFDEYETIPSSNVTDHMMAGAIAGIMEHCVMYPLDSVKVSVRFVICLCIEILILCSLESNRFNKLKIMLTYFV